MVANDELNADQKAKYDEVYKSCKHYGLDNATAHKAALAVALAHTSEKPALR